MTTALEKEIRKLPIEAIREITEQLYAKMNLEIKEGRGTQAMIRTVNDERKKRKEKS